MTASALKEMGIEEEQINKKKVDWAGDVLSLVKKGIIAELHIGRSRFERKLTKEDIGLDIAEQEFDRFLREYLDFGTKVLLPRTVKGKFDRIEGRARRVLYTHSFETPWGRFLPYTAFENYCKKRDECAADYASAKEDLKANLDLYNAETIRDYRKAAERIYERTSKSVSLESFTTAFIARVELQLPTAELIDETFYFTDDLYYIPLPSELEQDFLQADLVKRERLLEEAKTKAEMDKYRAEVAMHKETLSRLMETKKEKLDGMIDSFSQELRGAIYTTLRDVLESLKDRANLSGASVKSLQKLVDRTRMMNFIEDPDVDTALSKIEQLVGCKAAKKAGDSAAILREIAVEFRAFSLEDDDLPDIREFGVLL